MSEYDRIKMNSMIQDTRDVRSTDTGISDFDLNGSSGHLWFFYFLVLYVLICNYYCCFHNLYFLLSYILFCCHHMGQRLVNFKVGLISLVVDDFVLRVWFMAAGFFYSK